MYYAKLRFESSNTELGKGEGNAVAYRRLFTPPVASLPIVPTATIVIVTVVVTMPMTGMTTMNRSGLFNSPVQGSVPATPETHHDPRGVPAPWETQPNRRRLDAQSVKDALTFSDWLVLLASC